MPLLTDVDSTVGMRGGKVVREHRTPNQKVLGSFPTCGTVLCVLKQGTSISTVLVNIQECLASPLHDCKIVDRDVRPQYIHVITPENLHGVVEHS